MTAALELRGIHKRFGPVHALRGADFTLAAGEVHALLGENGAGKSTLMHIASGGLPPDAGSIVVAGRAVRPGSPRQARRLGIGLVHQHFTAIPAFTVAENIALSAGWQVAHPRQLNARASLLADRVGLPLDPEARTSDLTVGARQRLEILKALAADATILLLDEPTAVLAPAEAEDVLRRVRNLADAGRAAVLITHKLDEAIAVADRITVLREGRTVRTAVARTESAESLAAAMLGETSPILPGDPGGATRGETLVSVRGIILPREDGRGEALRAAELDVGAGDIIGFAAVDGSGQRELLRAVAGLLMPLSGTLTVAQPAAFIPEDRTTEGLIPGLSIQDNIALGIGPLGSWSRGGRIDQAALHDRTRDLIAGFGIRGAHPAAPAGSLSGGNQQKLVVGRALSRNPRVIVAENPTRGLDVRATAAVWSGLRAAVRGGAAVLVWSSDLEEVMVHSTRLAVVARGVLREVPPGAPRETIGAMMLASPAVNQR